MNADIVWLYSDTVSCAVIKWHPKTLLHYLLPSSGNDCTLQLQNTCLISSLKQCEGAE